MQKPRRRGIGKGDMLSSQGIHTLNLSTFFPKTIFTLPAMWFSGGLGHEKQ